MVVKKRRAKPLLIILIVLVLLVIASAVAIVVSWNVFTSPMNENNKEKIEVVIPNGTTNNQIATILKEKKLIRNELIFKVYIKLNKVNYLKEISKKSLQIIIP